MDDRNTTTRLLGKKMIEAAVNFDTCLVEVLRVELKRLKLLSKSNHTDLEELQKTNTLIKNIIIALTLTDEKVKTGIELYLKDNETEKL